MNLKLLRDKNFTLLMFGKITSLIGSSMQNFALSLFVLATTGSATKFASILAISIVPQLILGPFAGVIVDWVDRKKIIVYLDLASGAIVSIFAFLYITKGELPISYIYALVIMLSLISTLFQPASQTIIPSIVKKEDLVSANSISSLLLGVGNFLAPALAGVLYGTLGLKLIFIVNAVSFFVSAFSEMFIEVPKIELLKEKPSLKIFKRDFVNGIKFAGTQKTILYLVFLAMILNFSGGSLTVGLTYVCKSIMNVSDFQYGLVESLSVAAMMGASIFAGVLGKKLSVGKNLFYSLFFMGIFSGFYIIPVLPSILNGFSSNLPAYIILSLVTILISFSCGVANIFMGIYFQSVVPLDYMGRVGTVFSTGAMCAMPLGNMVYGYLFDKIPTAFVFIISTVLIIMPILYFRTVIIGVKTEDSVPEEKMEENIEAI